VVVVVQVDPTHGNLMAELRSHTTGLAVEQARDGQPLEADHVYINPANGTLTLDHDRLRVIPSAPAQALDGAIDRFFQSIAETKRDGAMAILLSGTKTDGALGVRAVKTTGGLAIVQSPETAAQPDIPRSVIVSRLADAVLAPDRMPPVLDSYVRHMRACDAPPRSPNARFEETLPALLTFLRSRTQYDFRGYSKATLQRRLARRMGVQAIGSVAAYLDFLHARPSELDRLFKDLLIAETSFFRDPLAFDTLATRVLAPLVRDRDQDAQVRIWVPGCSTGEEAYSIAIMLAEQIEAAQSTCQVKIFATDVDEGAIQIARTGVYPGSIALEVGPERLHRFFTRRGHHYIIADSIRESVVFDVANLTSAVPFSKLDLVSCRNVLIYPTRELRKQVLSLFHFALSPAGSLFLGRADTVDLDGLFTPISKRHRLFRRSGEGSRLPLDFIVRSLAPTDDAGLARIVVHDRIAAGAAREQTAEALRRMTRLHELSEQLAVRSDVEAMLKNVIRAGLDITGAELGIVQLWEQESNTLMIAAEIGFNQPFLDFFAHVDTHADSSCAAALANRQRVLVDDVTTSSIFLGRPSSVVMAGAGVRAVQSTPLFDRTGGFLGVFSTHYRVPHHFNEAELRWLDLLARHAADVIARHRADELLARAQQDLESRVADRTRWLSLMHEVMQAINEAATWDEALHRVLRRLCETEHWQIGFVYLPQPGNPDTIAPVVSCFGDERFRLFHDLSMQQTYGRGDRLPGRVYTDNAPFWAADTEALLTAMPVRAAAATSAGLRSAVALPVTVQGEVVAVLEIFSDRPHPPNEQLASLMQTVGDQIGRVLERERATARMADLVWREQQGLLHTLHDSLGQTLTGVGMLSAGLRQRLLTTDTETAETAAEIARQTQLALDQVRRLARNLFPVEVEAETLLAALHDLASATTSLHKIEVRVAGELPETLHDGKIATELYRIAQEAVTNTVKHAHAKAITIRVDGGKGLMRLVVADDGTGIAHNEPGDGAGLRIMRYRAASIGASLTVERGPIGGTIVTCTLREPPRSGSDM
jgi:chemotaxis methyl-accepting protein methylase/signal transduction histidine kinase